MTPQQRAAYDYIAGQIDKTGVSPNYREIAAAIGVKSKSRVFEIVKALVELGHIEQAPGRARSLAIPRTCPHCGLPINQRTAA